MKRTFWEELRPGYCYLWQRIVNIRYLTRDERSEAVLLAIFLVTFIPWLPIIYFAHCARKLIGLVGRLIRGGGR